MVFRSQEEADYVRERMDSILAAGLEEAGFVSFGFAGGGFATLMGQEPVTSLEDLRGRKIWVPEGDTNQLRGDEGDASVAGGAADH